MTQAPNPGLREKFGPPSDFVLEADEGGPTVYVRLVEFLTVARPNSYLRRTKEE